MIGLQERICLDPDLLNGRPSIRGKRIAVQTVLEFLSAGDSEADVLAAYPSLEPEDIRACLAYASKLMEHRFVLRDIA